MAKEKWTKSPWTIGVVCALLPLIITTPVDYLKKIPILTTISSIFKWLGKGILSFLTYQLEVWWIIIIAILILLLRKFKKKNSTSFDFLDYKVDRLKSWKWSWRWEWDNKYSTYRVSKMEAHCPSCDTIMQYSVGPYWKEFQCPRCSFIARDGMGEDPVKIEMLILDNIKRKEAEAPSQLLPK